jgi:drug/metabolite transporter (DMT)-like permease
MGVAGRTPDAVPLIAFAGVVVFGGANFVAVRFSNMELPPLWGAGLRFALAAGLFTSIVLALRLRWPRGRQLALTALYGALNFAVFYALMYWALVRVSAGAATVVLATVPLLTLLLAVAQGLEGLPRRGLVGGLLALVGIGWLSLGPSELVLPFGALAALLAGALCSSESIILAKRISANHPAVTNALGMTVGAALLLAMSAVAGESWTLPREADTVRALAYLVTLGSVGLFVLVLIVARGWTASATSYAFVLFPVATMALDALLLGEPITSHALAAAGLVMLGVWFGALSPGARRPAAASVEVAGTLPQPR